MTTPLKVKAVITTLTFCFLSTSALQAYEGCELPEPVTSVTCQIVKAKETQIEAKSIELSTLIDLQDRFEESKTLRDRILDNQNTLEHMNVDEKLRNEIALIIEDDGTQQTVRAGSVAALIVAGFIVQRMSRSTKGQALKRRLMAQFWPKEGKITRTSVNAGLFVSLAMLYFTTKKLYDNESAKADLQKMIDDLKDLKSQADKIATMREELEEMEACYWLQLDQLVEKGLANPQSEKLQCL